HPGARKAPRAAARTASGPARPGTPRRRLPGDQDSAAAERGRSVHDRLRASGRGVEREPERGQVPPLAPARTTAPVPGREVLGERREEDVPALVAGRRRLLLEQNQPPLARLVPVLLQEL